MAARSADVLQPTLLLSIGPDLLWMFQQLCIQNMGSPLTCSI